MSNTAKILLTAWAATRYDPAPSLWTLRKWARDGNISPAPEKVGRDWYVDPNARRITYAELTGHVEPPRSSLVDRIRAGT